MLVIIKSAPATPEGKRAVKIARDMAADICLIQDAVYFAQIEKLEGFCGTAYVLDDDIKLRGISSEVIQKETKKIDYNELIDLIINNEKALGVF